MKWVLSYLLVLVTSFALAQDDPRIALPIGSHFLPVDERVTVNKPLILSEPEATFVKVYFEPVGRALITVRNPSGSESYTYEAGKMDRHTKHGDNWAALSIFGNAAIVEVRRGSVMVTQVEFGLAQPIIPQSSSGPVLETTCGLDNKEWIACQSVSIQDRARPVAMIRMPTGSRCTAWRVGPGNMMMTNWHCTNTQEGVEGSEVWFDYQYTDCAGTLAKTPVKFAGKELLKTNSNYDYTLFTVAATEAQLRPFGWFGLEPRPAEQGERIYMIGHPQATRKKGMVKSDQNDSGFCEIDVASKQGMGGTLDADYGYWCDSEGGQSGSPVALAANGRAVALHHFGGCLNGGVKMSNIWTQISSFFGGIPPVGDQEIPPLPGGPVAVLTFDCVQNVCDYSAQGSVGSSWHWVFGDGAESTLFSGQHTYTDPAVYTIRLFVSDGASTNGAEKTLLITVPGYNFPPEARFTVTDEGGLVVRFTSESYDPDGRIVQHRWRVNDAGTWAYYDLPEFRHTFSVAGEHYADLKVTDDGGKQTPNVFKYFTVSGQPPDPPEPFCGDGEVDPGEECDDGNNVNGDGCDEFCKIEKPEPPPEPIIKLTVKAEKQRGSTFTATFRWTGAVGATVKLNSSTTANDGVETLKLHNREKGSQWKVCDTTGCSNSVVLDPQ